MRLAGVAIQNDQALVHHDLGGVLGHFANGVDQVFGHLAVIDRFFGDVARQYGQKCVLASAHIQHAAEFPHSLCHRRDKDGGRQRLDGLDKGLFAARPGERRPGGGCRCLGAEDRKAAFHHQETIVRALVDFAVEGMTAVANQQTIVDAAKDFIAALFLEDGQILGKRRRGRQRAKRDQRSHRSISPKTTSIVPMIAATSASWWPLATWSIACRCR